MTENRGLREGSTPSILPNPISVPVFPNVALGKAGTPL